MMMGEEFRRILLQEFESMARRVVCEELGKGPYNYINPIPRQLVGGAQQARYHLEFQNKICNPLHTLRKIQGEAAGSDVKIALFDNDKKVTVTSGPLSSIKVEIVVLNGDFNNDDRETWSEEEFNKRIALPRDYKPQLLKGERFIKLNNGIGSLGNIVFTDNSCWQKTQKFRLGVRYAQSAPDGERIQEGITEPFRVKDRRGESTQKPDTPSLDGEVWQLKHIAKDGKFHKMLQGHGIKTVQDLLTYHNMEKGNLRNFLGRGMSETYWKEIVKQARECDPGDRLYSYSMREKNTVVDSVESWKNLAYRNINGTLLDHRMINDHPMPLLMSDVTSLPGSSTPPPHNSNSQIRNFDQVDSQVDLLQETSVQSEDSRNLFMDPYIDVDNHQPSYAETSNLPLEMGNSSFNNISTAAPNSEFPGVPVTYYAFGTQAYSPGIETPDPFLTTVKDVPFERDNSPVFTIPMETAPTEDEQATPVCPLNQVESSPFMDQSIFSRMSSFDPIFFEGLIQTSISNDPASSDGETSRSIAQVSSPPRWLKLLAPIKWVQFTKKRRARILVHQTLAVTV